MVVEAAGLGSIIGQGALNGHVLSIGIFLFLLMYLLTTKRTALEKILMTWYAWYGVVYLFDPQMMIQLFPIVVLTPGFSLFFYRLADVLNAFIIMFYFIGSNHPQLPHFITDQLTPFGLTNIEGSIRQVIFLSAYFLCFNPKLQTTVRNFTDKLGSALLGPVSPTTPAVRQTRERRRSR